MTTTLQFTNELKLKTSLSFEKKFHSSDMKTVASIILGGGEGTRLYPLTLTKCKPAVNFGGKYRIIDVPLSHSIHANCDKIFVLTQFLSSSLHKHIYQTYMQNGKTNKPIEILTAEQKPTNKSWYQGTADAVRQNLDYLLEFPADYFLILSGDQLYNLDFCDMLHFAKETDADVTIAALPVHAEEASRLGILKINSNNFITDFFEKPQDRDILLKLQTPPGILNNLGISTTSRANYLGSMGIYLFKRRALIDLLLQDPREDFGKHLIPTKVQSGQAAAFIYNGYWEDIGTLQTFYEANMALTKPNAPFNFLNEKKPIFFHQCTLPPTQFTETKIKHSIINEGCMIEAHEISGSVIGLRTTIAKNSVIKDSYLMGNDYYTSNVTDHPRLPLQPKIGENCLITRSIIDKNVSIGNHVQLVNKQKLRHYNGDNIYIRDGIIVVPRGATIPNGFIL
jgi:glucose-1-phosphate adenylyltransferase